MEGKTIEVGDCFKWPRIGLIKIVEKLAVIHAIRYKIEIISVDAKNISRIVTFVSSGSINAQCEPLPAEEYQKISDNVAACSGSIRALVSDNMSNH